MKNLRGVVFFLLTVLLYLGVPLAGWGLDDPGGFFALAPRAGYALVVTLFALAVGWQSVEAPEGVRGGREETGQRVRRQTAVRVVIDLELFGALLLLPLADRHDLGVMPPGTGVRWAGLALLAGGVGLVFASGLALGRFYSPEVTLQRDHRLVTSGLYSHLRNPRYLGVILVTAGLALVFRSWLGIFAAIFVVLVILARIPDEEALLRRAFGEEYEAYYRRSWRLLPWIY